MLIIGAANRDPKHFEDPDRLSLERRNARDHLAFGRGIHSCAGAPLARAETRIVLERLFDATSSIGIDENFHGQRTARRYEFEPTYMFCGLTALHLELTPAVTTARVSN
jgi:cytochrome P450 family 150 subfamily A5